MTGDRAEYSGERTVGGDSPSSLRVEGRVARPATWTFEQLRQLEDAAQVSDVRTLGAKRAGAAVRLERLLAPLGVDASVTHIGLHGTRDNFHASIPLGADPGPGAGGLRMGGTAVTRGFGRPFPVFYPRPRRLPSSRD